MGSNPTAGANVNRTKVALVVPKCEMKLSDVCPPWNLGYIASYLRKHLPEVEVQIYDGMSGQNPYTLMRIHKPDIVGVTAVTPQAPEAYRFIDWVKCERLAQLVVMGGVHASVMAGEASQHADVVVVGEGETAFLDIVRSFVSKEDIPMVVVGIPVENLDELPPPAYDLINVKEYLRHSIPLPDLTPPVVSLTMQRGCPFRCVFCYNSSRTSKVRYFSAERIVEEILFFHKMFGVTSFFFIDDEFLINRKRLEKMSKLFYEKGICEWVKWGCQARAKSVAEETLVLAKSIGCVAVAIGFESANQRVLGYLKNGTTTVADNERALEAAQKVGVNVCGSFIFGSPSETMDEMKQTFRWFERHKALKLIGINTLIPYPGTKLWELCERLRLLPEEVDYERLVPASLPKGTYVIDRAVDAECFNSFVVDAARLAWLYTQTRSNSSLMFFFKLAKFRTWWWAWLFHPCKMFKLMVKRR